MWEAFIETFVNQPIPCVLVAAALTVPVFLQYSTTNEKVGFGFSAAVWWLFILWEAVWIRSVEVWRIDLIFFGPAMIVALVIGVWCFLPFMARAGGWAQMPREK